MKIDLTVNGYIIHQNKILLVQHSELDIWLPVGGHIEKNETPDQALLREIKEEVGLDVEILNKNDMPIKGNTKYNLATPFLVNVHSVKDHDHCGLFYICRALNPEQIKINKELKNFKWFVIHDLDKENIQPDVKMQCLEAFEFYRQF